MKIGVIIFGSVRFLSKKITKPKFFFFEKKNRNRVKPTGFGSVRFGFFRAKTGSNRFGSVFPVLARFFPVLARFFSSFLSVSVRFGFFGFLLIKTKPNRTEPTRFFKNLIGFFSVRFFLLFFSGFLGLIGFPVFLLTPTWASYFTLQKIRLDP